jgi:hypothetical protein
VSGRRFLALLVAALAIITFAFWLSAQRYLPRDRSFGTPVLAGLAPSVDDVRSVRIVGAGNAVLVTLDRPDGRWRVAELDYPADGRRVRALLRTLGELHMLERKTRDPANYARLGVEDVASATATGLRVELRGAAGPVALIVGREADPSSGYVRVAGAAETLLATPRLDLDREPRAWLARTIVDVTPARVQAAEITRAGSAAWRAERPARGAPLAFAGLPAGRELDDGASEIVANALAALELDDVRDARTFTPAGAESHATYRTFDGLVLAFTGREDGDARWLRVDASVDAAQADRFPPGAGDDAPGDEQVRAEAARIATAATRRWYRVGGDRYDRVFRPLAPLLRPRGSR